MKILKLSFLLILGITLGNVKYSPFFGGNVNDINTAEEIYKIFESLKSKN